MEILSEYGNLVMVSFCKTQSDQKMQSDCDDKLQKVQEYCDTYSRYSKLSRGVLCTSILRGIIEGCEEDRQQLKAKLGRFEL